MVMGLADCPTYFKLHVLHFVSYIPLGFLFYVFSVNCWYIVFVALNAKRISVFLNRLVTFLIIGLWYVNATHFFCFYFSCVSFVLYCLSLFLIISFLSMSMICCMGKPLCFAVLSIYISFLVLLLYPCWVVLSFCLCNICMLHTYGPVGG